MSKKISILIVDDDRQVLSSTAEWLQSYGHFVATAENAENAKKKATSQFFDLALVDLRLGAGSGLEVLACFREKSPETVVVMISGHGTIDIAMQAVREGACDFLTKPLLDDKILDIIEKLAVPPGLPEPEPAGEAYRVDVPSPAESPHFAPPADFEGVIGNDPRMQHVYEIIENVADTRATVLITGESGTGKSMIARAIHRRSTRKNKPFVEVACGSLPETLLESELFGHVAGAFTDAKTDKIGRFRQADGGTIFLDEIGTASPALQIKLLRVLQELEFEPVGGAKTYRVDTRVILATNENLTQALEDGKFREDLYYRINVINIELPALRHRPGDIPLLARAFLQNNAHETGRPVYGFTDEAMAVLQMYAWKGNIRELQNVIERAVLLGRHDHIRPEDLPAHLIPPSGIPVLSRGYRDSLAANTPAAEQSRRGLKDSLSTPERQIILQALQLCNWSRTKTAEYLGINRTTLYKKMKRFKISKTGHSDRTENAAEG